jgi:1,4-dihydroxy-2-naphthoate octaprenyltransferase
VSAQIVSNFANDYFDYAKGVDNKDRSGPRRAVAEGWIAPKTMLRATAGLLAADMALGLSLVWYGGWALIPVGIAIALVAVAYSGGAYPLSHHGWGDLCVFVFFGIVPVGFAYYVQALRWTMPATLCGAAMGLVNINILVANNYRDRFTDAATGKRTTVVLFGEKFGRRFYLFNGIIAVLCCLYLPTEKTWTAFLPMIYLFFHVATWREMVKTGSGKQLTGILGKTARNVLIFGLLLAIELVMN